MEMNFPHPRKAALQRTARSEFDALVARAVSRQATSPTVRAILAQWHGQDRSSDCLSSRIAYFSGRRTSEQFAGAFLTSDEPGKYEEAVYRAASNKRNQESSECLMQTGQTARGMED